MQSGTQNTKSFWPLVAVAALLAVFLAQPAWGDKYWVGPTTNNNWTNANNWSNTDGGPGGAGEPGVSEDVFLTQSGAVNKKVNYNTALNPQLFILTVDATGSGTITLNQAAGNLSTGLEYIGFNGTGTFTQSGGNHNVFNELWLGDNVSASGTYNLKGGGFLSAFSEFIGRYGTGAFNQLGGDHTVTTDLKLGTKDTGSGAYFLKSGSLSVFRDEYIGVDGAGEFTQNGGTHTVNRDLYVGFAFKGQGSYDLHTGHLSVGGRESIGVEGGGTFTQSGGVHTARELVLAAGNSPDHSTYNLETGRLTVENEAIGFAGYGTFNQSGGVHTVTETLKVTGGGVCSGGTYNLMTGSLTAPVEVINNQFSQTGGLHTVTDILYIGKEMAIDRSLYTLKTGTLSAARETIGYGSGSIGIFNQTGGIHTVTDTLILADEPAGNTSPSTGTYNLQGGTLSAGTIQINAHGDFNVKNTTTTVTGNVVNQGLVRTNNADVTWKGAFTNNGIYLSDPSTQTFKDDLTVSAAGYIVGHSQDLFIIKEDFINQSANAANWDTALAGLKFATGADNSHDFYIPGEDNGDSGTNAFAWHILSINNQIINLFDGDPITDGALYVRILKGAVLSGLVVTNIFGDAASTLNIYYDPIWVDNQYLKGLTYDFAGGLGQLIPDPPALMVVQTPVPASIFLLGSGLLGLGLLGWRRKQG